MIIVIVIEILIDQIEGALIDHLHLTGLFEGFNFLFLIKHDLFVILEIVRVHHVIETEIDMDLHAMIVHLEVINVEVDGEEEVAVVIISVVEVEVIITIINVNRINHVLDLIITNNLGKIVEEEDAVVVEEVFMIVNVIWVAIIDLMNSYHQVINLKIFHLFFF